MSALAKIDAVNDTVDSLWKVGIIVAIGVAGYGLYKLNNAVDKAIDQPLKDFWAWYYDLNERPDWVRDFTFDFWERDFFNDMWKIRADVYEVYNKAYPEVMAKVLDSNMILKPEFRGEIQ